MDEQREIPVAIKVYRLTLRDPDDKIKAVDRRLIRESNAWLDLDHRHVQQYYGHCGGLALTIALISPLRENGNIIDFLATTKYTARQCGPEQCEPGKCAAAVRFKLVTEIADGLLYLHSEDLVHGDLHCGNVLIDDNGCALLTDFGRSKKKQEEGYSTKFFAGSTRHLAPEFFLDENADDEDSEVKQDCIFGNPTDIYAFSMVCFEVLSGDRPFKRFSDLKVIAVLREKRRPKPADVANLNTHIPQRVWEIMNKCWDQEPTQRPSAREVVQSLAKLVQ